MSDKGMVVPGVEVEFDSEFDDIQFDLQEVHALLADALFKLGRRDMLRPLRDALETGQKWLVEEANRRIAERG